VIYQINQLQANDARATATLEHQNAVDASRFYGLWASNACSFRADKRKWPSSISIMQQ
jgi:hypothetical protein